MPGHQDDDRWRGRHQGRDEALQTLTSSGTPLLAGFSITMIGVVAQAPDRFSVPALTILLLTVAAIAFAISIHCYFWARIHQPGPAELRSPLVGTGVSRDPVRDHFAHRAWGRRLHVCFQSGILMLFVGLGSAVWPGPGEANPGPRFAAVACCGAMVLLVLFWTFGFFFAPLVAAADGGSWGARLVLLWFRPGGRAYEAHLARAAAPQGAALGPVPSTTNGGRGRGRVPDVADPARPMDRGPAPDVERSQNAGASRSSRAGASDPP